MTLTQVLVIELGARVVLRFDSQPRDFRWFRGLYR